MHKASPGSLAMIYMAFMAAMFPAQFGHFAGNPAPSPAVTQLEQAQPIVPAVNQQTTQVLLLQVLSCVEWCNSAIRSRHAHAPSGQNLRG